MAQAFTRRNLVRGSVAVAGACAADALLLEPRWLEVTRHDVPVADLPRHLEGFSIAHITDAHLTSLGATEESIAQALRAERVQLAVLTGDIVDSEQRFSVLRQFCAAIRNQGQATVATLGNWEHWGNVPLAPLSELYRDLSVTLLGNASLTLSDGVHVVATDDSTGGDAQIRHALETSRSGPRLLLTHSPALLDTFPGDTPRFALSLCGHTHGGQVRITEHFAPVRPPGSGRFVSGWYETAAGRAYVSRGTGTSLLPARFTCRPELPVLRLVRA